MNGSQNIDERIVSMEFDNSKFERGVQTTLHTLAKLKDALNFDGASKGLSSFSSSIQMVSKDAFGNLTSSIGEVTTKFGLMELTALNAMERIANKAVDIGERIVSALTIDPVKTGMSEYEEKMTSVQTIMASTGEDLGTVKQYLEELNLYADKTIYSFKDMTSNIGKFTNAGVDLGTAVQAIQGVSNLAALSGSTSEQNSRAMYNISQALGTGYMLTRDWMSIENAGMATVQFKQALIDTAEAMGVVGEGMINLQNFRESLSEKWLTNDVLVSTLQMYNDASTELGQAAIAAATEIKTFSQLWDTLKEAAQSGWAMSWEYLIGDFEEAKIFLTQISDISTSFLDRWSDERNQSLKVWHNTAVGIDENGEAITAWADTVDSALTMLRALFDSLQTVRDAFMEADGFTSETMLGLTDRLRQMADFIKEMNDALTGATGAWTEAGIYAVDIQGALSSIGHIVGAITKSAKKFVGYLVDGIYYNLEQTLNKFVIGLSFIDDVATYLATASDEASILQMVVSNLYMGFKKAAVIFYAAAGAIHSIFLDFDETADGLYRFTDDFVYFMKTVWDYLDQMNALLDDDEFVLELRDIFTAIVDSVKILAAYIMPFVRVVPAAIDSIVGSLSIMLSPLHDIHDYLYQDTNLYNNLAYAADMLSSIIEDISVSLADGAVSALTVERVGDSLLFVAVGVYKFIEKITESLYSNEMTLLGIQFMANRIGNAFSRAFYTVMFIVNQIGDALADVFSDETIFVYLGQIADGFASAFGLAAKILQPFILVMPQLVRTVMKFAAGISNYLYEALYWILEGGYDIAYPIYNIISSIIGIIDTAVSVIGDAFVTIFPPQTVVSVLYTILSVIDAVVSGIYNVVAGSDVLYVVFGVIASIIGNIITIIASLGGFVAQFLPFIVDGIVIVATALGNAVSYLAEFVSYGNALETIGQILVSVFGIAFFLVGGVVSGAWELIKAFGALFGIDVHMPSVEELSNALTTIRTKVENLRNYIVNTFTDLRENFTWANIKAHVKDIFDRLKAFVEAHVPNIPQMIINKFTEWKVTLSPAGLKNLFNGIVNSIVEFGRQFIPDLPNPMDAFGGIVQKIKDFFGSIFGLIGDNLGNAAGIGVLIGTGYVLKTVFKLVNGIAGIVSGLGGAMENMSNVVGAFAKSINASAFLTYATGLYTVVKAIAVLALVFAGLIYLNNTDYGKEALVASLLEIIFIAAILYSIYKALMQVDSSLSKTTVVTERIKSSLSTLTNTGAFLGIAMAIVMLTGVLYLLSKIDNDLTDIFKFALLIAAVGVIGFMLSKMSQKIGENEKVVSARGRTFVAVGISMLLLCAVLDKLSKYDIDVFAWSLLKLIGMFGVFYRIIKLMNDLKFTGGKDVLMFVGSMWLLAMLIEKVSKVPWLTYAVGVAKAIPLFAALYAIAWIAKKNQTEFSGGGKTMLALASSMIFLSIAVRVIAGLPFLDAIVAAGAIAGLAFAMAGAIRVIAGSEYAISNAKGVALALLSMAGSLFIIAGAIAVLSLLNIGKVILGSVIIALILWEVASLVKGLASIKQLNTKGLSGILNGFSLIIFTLTGSLAGLAVISKYTSIWSAFAVLILILSIFTGLAKSLISSGISDDAGAKKFTSLAAIIVALAGSVVALSMLDDPTKMVLAAACISGVLLAFGILVKLVEKSKEIGWWEVAKCVVLLASAVVAIIALGYLTNNLDADALLKMSLGLASVMVGIGAMVLISGFAKSVDWKVLLMALGLAAIVVVSMIALSKFADTKSIEKIGSGLSEAMLGLAEALLVLAVAGAVATVAIPGLIAIGAAFLALIVIFAICAAWEHDQKGALDGIISAADKLGTAIGTFFGAIGGSSASRFGKGLEDFANSTSDFFKMIDNLSDKTFEKFEKFVDILTTFVKAEFWDKFGDLFGGSNVDGNKLGSSAAGFAAMMREFGSINLTELQVESAQLAVDILKALSDGSYAIEYSVDYMSSHGEDFANVGLALTRFITAILPGAIIATPELLDRASTAVGILTGVCNALAQMTDVAAAEKAQSDLFGEESVLESFGVHVSKFMLSLKLLPSIDDTVKKNATNAVSILSSFTKACADIPPQAKVNLGFLSGFVGGLITYDTTLDGFGERINTFCTELTKIPTISKEASDNAIAASKILDTFVKIKVPETVTTSTNIFGFMSNTSTNDLATFGTKIHAFATSMGAIGDVEFSENVKTNADSAAEILERWAKVEVPVTTSSSKSLLGLLFQENTTSSNDLGTFGERIAAFAENVSGMATVTKDDLDTAENTAKLLEKFTNISDGMSSDNTKTIWEEMADLGELAKYFEELGNNISLFGDGMKSLSTSISGVDFTKVNQAVDVLAKIAPVMVTLTKDGNKQFGSLGANLETFGTNLATFGSKAEATNWDGVDQSMDVISGIMGYIAQLDKMKDPSTAITYINEILSLFTTDRIANITEVASKLKGVLLSKDNLKMLRDAGITLIKKVIDGIGSKCTEYKKSLSDNSSNIDVVLTSIITKIESYYQKFVDAGKYITDGLAIGMASSESLPKAVTTISQIGSKIIGTFANKLKIKSPSRVMMEMGQYISEGLAIGISDGSNMVETSTTSLADVIFDIFDVSDIDDLGFNHIANLVEDGMMTVSGVMENTGEIAAGITEGMFDPDVAKPVMDYVTYIGEAAQEGEEVIWDNRKTIDLPDYGNGLVYQLPTDGNGNQNGLGSEGSGDPDDYADSLDNVGDSYNGLSDSLDDMTDSNLGLAGSYDKVAEAMSASDDAISRMMANMDDYSAYWDDMYATFDDFNIEGMMGEYLDFYTYLDRIFGTDVSADEYANRVERTLRDVIIGRDYGAIIKDIVESGKHDTSEDAQSNLQEFYKRAGVPSMYEYVDKMLGDSVSQELRTKIASELLKAVGTEGMDNSLYSALVSKNPVAVEAIVSSMCAGIGSEDNAKSVAASLLLMLESGIIGGYDDFVKVAQNYNGTFGTGSTYSMIDALIGDLDVSDEKKRELTSRVYNGIYDALVGEDSAGLKEALLTENGLSDWLTELLGADVSDENIQTISTNLEMILTSGIENIDTTLAQNATQNVLEAILGGDWTKVMDMASNTGLDIGSALTGALFGDIEDDSKKQELTEAIDGLLSGDTSAGSIIDIFKTKGEEGLRSYLEGLTNSDDDSLLGKATSALAGLVQKVLPDSDEGTTSAGTSKSSKGIGKTHGQAISHGIAEGINLPKSKQDIDAALSEATGRVEKNTSGSTNAGKVQAQSFADGAYNYAIGSDMKVKTAGISHALSAGIYAGSKDNTTGIYLSAAAKQFASTLEGQIRTCLGIHSPSTVFANIGTFCGLGLANGFMDSSEEAKKSATNMALNVLDGIQRMLDNDLDTTFTITPVVDSTAARLAMSNATSTIFGSAGFDAIRSADLAASIGSTSKNVIQVNSTYDDSGIRTAVSELKTEVRSLGDRISRMQFVINKKNLVDEVIDDVDQRLGRRLTMSMRGRMR